MIPAGCLALAGLISDGGLTPALEVVEQRCFECHAGNSVKGGLGLDTLDGWKRSIDVADPASSELLYRLRLPADDADAMPPKGERVSEAMSLRLETWMADGADLAPVETFLGGLAERQLDRVRLIETLSKELGASVREVRTLGSAGPSSGLEISWSHQPNPPTTQNVQRLAGVAEELVELGFAGTAVTDEMLIALPELPVLRRVHLERTAVTARGVAALMERAPELRYLNLHSAAVDAYLLYAVPALRRLQTLVLFNTPADRPSDGHPFAAIASFQPRRLLAVDRAGARVALLREVGLDTYELLWEAAVQSEVDPTAYWLGGTRSEGAKRSPGIDDGHGRVAVQLGPKRFVEYDTRSGTSTAPHAAPRSYAAKTARPADGKAPQRLSTGHRVLVLPWRDRPLGQDEAPRPQLIEKNAAGEIVWTFADVKRFPEGFRRVQVIERTP